LEISTKSLVDAARRLSTSLVCDRLYDHGSVIRAPLINVTPGLLLAGPAFPITTEGAILPILQALDVVPPHHVLVIQDTSASERALLGDIILTAARQQELGGVVCLGTIRDLDEAPKIQVPLWASGASPQAAGLGRRAPQVPCDVTLGTTLVRPGDWLFGDRDGLVCVDREWIRVILKAAALKGKKERLYKERLCAGERLTEMMNVRRHLEHGEPIVVEF
jgi:4-hydroxy-4-methyl-2-oxoglutarate aldolase